MTENKKNNKNQKVLTGNDPILMKEQLLIKEVAILSDNNINNKNSKKDITLNDNIKKTFNNKDTPQSLKNSINFSKAQTKSREIDKRYDIFGNLIQHKGNHHVSFIDRVSKNNFVEVIKIDNYKEYNKMEEIAPTNGNGCCVII